MNRSSTALALLLSVGCAPEIADLPTTHTQPIINGSVVTDTPWAVMVVQQPAGTTRVRLCTGTVIGPRAVLTAKHCVFLDNGDATWQALTPAELTVRSGLDYRASTRTVAVESVRTTDGPYHDGDGRNGGDIAVLITRDDLEIEPRAVSRAPVATGNTVRIVGYGYTMAGATVATDLGVVHDGAATVATVESNVFSTTGAQWTCTGDSGGPAVDARGALVGVTSIGPTGCRVSTSYYTRVDRYLSLFEDLLPPSTSDAGATSDAASDAPAVTSDAPASDGALPPASGDASGGCHTSPGRATSGAMWLLVALGLWMRRARSSR